MARIEHYSARDGLTLDVKIHDGADAGTSQLMPIICLPGLMRNADDFDDLARYFSQQAKIKRTVYAFTFRGRGRSDFDQNPSNYTIVQEAEDVIAGLDVFGIEHGIFIGTSRGGMVMHLLAAMRPTALKLNILNDIGPELDGAGLMQIRTFMERLPALHNWQAATEFLKQSNGKAFPDLADEDWLKWAKVTFKEGSNNAIVPNFDRHLLDGLKDIDLSVALPTLWPQFKGLGAMPCLTLRGAHSQLLTEDILEKMADQHPLFESHVVPNQGHAPLLDTPQILKVIEAFIAKHIKKH